MLHNFLQGINRKITQNLGLFLLQGSKDLNTAPISESQFDFLLQVLKATKVSKGDANVIHSLLKANEEKLDMNFAQVLCSWATATLSDLEIEKGINPVIKLRNIINFIKTRNIVRVIINFSDMMQGFHFGSRADNLEIAITGYEIALSVFTQERFAYEWARTQNNLGLAYSDRIKGEKAENLELAISCYKNALKKFKRFPKDWARTQNNLGAAYSDRIQGEKAENLELAIDYYKRALEVYTRKRFAYEWGMMQNNLGVAYSNRIQEEKAENLELAIDYYKSALEVYTRKGFAYEWAMTQNNLGNAYSNRIQGEKAENLELAIDYYKRALEEFKSDLFSEDWAMTQINLGNAYSDRVQGEKAENLELAIDYYKRALEVYTHDRFPYRWAITQNNLGNAYREYIQEEKAENLELAIDYYKRALEVRTCETLPQDHAETSFNLGLTYIDVERFADAYNIFKFTIDTVEFLRDEIVSGDKVKQKLAEEWNKLYSHMVEVCLKLGNINAAVEYAERSKTRNLVELIFNRDLKTIFPPKVACKLEKLRNRITSGQYQIQTATADNPTALAQSLQKLRLQRNKLQDKYLPIGYGFKFDKFQATLDNHTAIIQWYITSTSFQTFIYTRHSLKRLTLSTPNEDLKALDDWGEQYLTRYEQDKRQWINTLASRLSDLALILDLEGILKLLPNSCFLRLILIPHRYLHLFPIHALPLAKGDFLCDRFLKGVGYAPSCQLLRLAQERGQYRHNFSQLFAIENPSRPDLKPLLGSKLEVNKIRQHFDPKNSIVVSEAQASETTLAQRMNQLRSAHCVHFSCHGKFEPQSPLESALKLADPEGKLGKEADLTLGKILEKFNLDQCRLVTFSACESGITDPTSISDEYIGLPSGFLYAGTPSVVSTLWTVDPLATTLLLTKFYKNLKRLPQLEAGSVATALNQAQIWLRTFTSKKLARIQTSHKFQLLLEQAFENQKRERMKFNDLVVAAIKRQPYPFANPYYWACSVTTGL